jgi:hypothetical protein
MPIRRGVIFQASSSIVIARDGKQRVVPVATTYMGTMNTDELIVFETPQADVGLLDLATGSTVLFPQKKPNGSTITADDTRVVFREPTVHSQSAIAVWTIRVPRDPVQLRAWLATITNAKAIPNSDAVAYP